MADLDQREFRFVTAYAVTGNIEQSAREAGYSASYARKNSYRLLDRPAIKAELAKLRAAVVENTGDALKDALAELDRMIAEARAAKQFTAVSSMLTTKAKLKGLLVERHQVATESLDLADAVQRIHNYNRYGSVIPPKVIDATHTEVAPDPDDPMA